MLKHFLQLLPVAFCTAVPAMAQTELDKEIRDLSWYKREAVYNIPGSRGAYSLGANERMLMGDQARRFLELTLGNSGGEDAVAVIEILSGPTAGSLVYIQDCNIGYLDEESWDKVSPEALIQDHIKSLWATNIVRKVNGYPTLEILSWAQEPTYDKSHDEIYSAVEMRDSEGATMIVAVALKLGRYGVSVLTWIGDPRQFQDVETILGPTLSRYSFQEGARYADFVPGDAVATARLRDVMLDVHSQERDAGALMAAQVLIFLRKFWYIPEYLWFILPLTFMVVARLAMRR